MSATTIPAAAPKINPIANRWEVIALSLLRHLASAGFAPVSTDNGDGEVATPTPEAMAAEATACDDAHCYLVKDGRCVWLWLVLGNSPSELACDFTATDEFDAAITAWSDTADAAFGN
jgi:hypothetical protein